MALDGLTNEVLRLLLAQNNLAISGTREQLLERLSEISPQSISAATDEPPQKRTRTGRELSNPSTSTGSSDAHVDLTGGQDVIPNDGVVNPANEQNPREVVASEINQDGRQTGGVPPQQNVASDPLALANLISTIVEEKLKSIHPSRPADHSQPQQPPASLLSHPTRQQMTDPAFVASLLTQASASQQPSSNLNESSLATHVSQKTKQAILRGEYVEFDSLLPENSSLSNPDLPGVSISFDGKQIDLPSPARRKKTHVDSIDKWLSAFAVYCTVLLSSFPLRAVEMSAYQEIIRSSHRKFAGLAWLSYDIDFRRKAAANPSLNWGQRDLQLYLMKFTGQARTCCSICGSGDHFAYGCSLSALRPDSTARGTCNNFNKGFKCVQEPCPYTHRCKICNADHPSFRHDQSTGKTRGQGDKKQSHR